MEKTGQICIERDIQTYIHRDRDRQRGTDRYKQTGRQELTKTA